jgi:hypothetical protein
MTASLRVRRSQVRSRHLVPPVGALATGDFAASLIAAYPLLEQGGSYIYDRSQQSQVKSGTLHAGSGDGVTRPGWHNNLQTPMMPCLSSNGGQGEYVDLTSPSISWVDGATPFSVSLWFWIPSGALITPYPQMATLRGSSGNPLAIIYSETTGYVGAGFGSSATWTPGRSGAALSRGIWHHLVLMYNGAAPGTLGNFTMYLDDQLQTLVSSGAFGALTNQTVLLGTGTSSVNSNFWGYFGPLYMWQRPLARGEVSALYFDPFAPFRGKPALLVPPTSKINVGSQAAIVWNSRTSTGLPIAQKWEYRVALGKQDAEVWNVRATPGLAKTVLWNALSYHVGNQAAIVFLTRIHIGLAFTELWNARNKADAAEALVWNARVPLGVPAAQLWNVQAAPGKSITYLFNTGGGAVGKQAALIWSAHVAPGSGRTVLWLVRAYSRQQLYYRWSLRAPAGRKTSVAWNVGGLAVGQQRALVWKARAPVSQGTAQLWNLRITRGRPRSVLWDARVRTNQSRAFVWNIRAAAAGLSRQLRWNYRVVPGLQRALAWRVRLHAGQPRSLSWNVFRPPVGMQAVLLWKYHGTIGLPRSVVWNARRSAYRAAAISWNTRHTIAISGALKWNVHPNAIAKICTLLWNTHAAITPGVQRAVVWNYRLPLGRPRALLWDYRLPAGTPRALLWKLRATPGIQRACKWNVIGSGFYSQRAILWNARIPTSRQTAAVYNVRRFIGKPTAQAWNVHVLTGQQRILVWKFLGYPGLAIRYVWNAWSLTSPPIGDISELEDFWEWDAGHAFWENGAMQTRSKYPTARVSYVFDFARSYNDVAAGDITIASAAASWMDVPSNVRPPTLSTTAWTPTEASITVDSDGDNEQTYLIECLALMSDGQELPVRGKIQVTDTPANP